MFALDGGVTTFTALSSAELAGALPRNGGGFAYVREAFPSPVSFVMGWTRWFTYVVAGALYALLSVAALVALNGLSTEASGGAETAITLVKIAILGVLVAVGTLGAGPLATAGETAIARVAGGFVPSLPLLGTGASLVAFGRCSPPSAPSTRS